MAFHVDASNIQLVCTIEALEMGGVVQVAGELVFAEPLPSDWRLSLTVGSESGDRANGFAECKEIGNGAAVFLGRVDVRKMPRAEVICMLGIHLSGAVIFERRMTIDLKGIVYSEPGFASNLTIDERSIGTTQALWLAGTIRNDGIRPWLDDSRERERILLGTRILSIDEPRRLVDERRQVIGDSMVNCGQRVRFNSACDTTCFWPGWYASYIDVVLEGKFWFAQNFASLPHTYFSIIPKKSLMSRLSVLVVVGDGLDDTTALGSQVLDWLESVRTAHGFACVVTNDKPPSRTGRRVMNHLSDLGIPVGTVESMTLTIGTDNRRWMLMVLPSDSSGALMDVINQQFPSSETHAMRASDQSSKIDQQIFRYLNPRSNAWRVELEVA
jgi:hypothetical protein